MLNGGVIYSNLSLCETFPDWLGVRSSPVEPQRNLCIHYEMNRGIIHHQEYQLKLIESAINYLYVSIFQDFQSWGCYGRWHHWCTYVLLVYFHITSSFLMDVTAYSVVVSEVLASVYWVATVCALQYCCYDQADLLWLFRPKLAILIPLPKIRIIYYSCSIPWPLVYHGWSTITV